MISCRHCISSVSSTTTIQKVKTELKPEALWGVARKGERMGRRLVLPEACGADMHPSEPLKAWVW